MVKAPEFHGQRSLAGHSLWGRRESDTLRMHACVSQANEWEEYSGQFGEVVGISRNWATAHFLTFVAPAAMSHLAC